MKNLDTGSLLVGRGNDLASVQIEMRAVWVGLVLLVISLISAAYLQTHPDAYSLAKAAPMAGSGSIADRELIGVTGSVELSRQIGDGDFVPAGEYLMLKRIVEVYAWAERPNPEAKDAGAVVYVQVWTERPADSRMFRRPEGHMNLPPSMRSVMFYAPLAAIKGLRFQPTHADLPAGEALVYTEELVKQGRQAHSDLVYSADGYVYRDQIASLTPSPGAIRMRWEVVCAGEIMTAFGAIHDGQLVSHKIIDPDGELTLTRGGRHEALRTLHRSRSHLILLAEQCHLIPAGLGAATLVLAVLSGVQWREQKRWKQELQRWGTGVLAATLGAVMTVVWAFSSMSSAWLSPGLWVVVGLFLFWWADKRPRSLQAPVRSSSCLHRAKRGQPMVLFDRE